MLSTKKLHNSFYIITTVFWIAVYCVFMKYALKWDNEKKLEAEDMYGQVDDRSAEAYYP